MHTAPGPDKGMAARPFCINMHELAPAWAATEVEWSVGSSARRVIALLF